MGAELSWQRRAQPRAPYWVLALGTAAAAAQARVASLKARWYSVGAPLQPAAHAHSLIITREFASSPLYEPYLPPYPCSGRGKCGIPRAKKRRRRTARAMMAKPKLLRRKPELPHWSANPVSPTTFQHSPPPLSSSPATRRPVKAAPAISPSISTRLATRTRVSSKKNKGSKRRRPSKRDCNLSNMLYKPSELLTL